MASVGTNPWNWTDPTGLNKKDGKGCWKNTHAPSGKDHLATFEVEIEDPGCEEVNFIQVFRTRSYTWTWSRGWQPSSWWGWEIDDGSIGLLSDPAPAAPFYEDPKGCQPGHKPGDVTKPPIRPHEFSDEPESYLCKDYEFETCAVCRKGASKGKIYSCIQWGLQSCRNETSSFSWKESGGPSDEFMNFKTIRNLAGK
jgi:hypothetical protein